jgi:iron-sulfur cluster assembly protein
MTLALTRNAVDSIGALKNSSDEIPDSASLRIAAQVVGENDASFELALVESPEQGDTVVEAESERVFLQPLAASMLDDKVLDAEIEESQIRFTITPQGPADGASAAT